MSKAKESAMQNTLISMIEAHAQQTPDREAVVFKKDVLTYAQLAARIAAAGRLLMGMGIQRGDCVLYTALSKPETVVTYLGIQYAGATAVAMDKNATPENGYAIYADTQACLYLTDRPMKGFEEKCRLHSLKAFYAQVCADAQAGAQGCEADAPQPEGSAGQAHAAHAAQAGRVAVDAEDIAEMIFTTGTTGRPKGVMLSFRAVWNISMNTIKGIGIEPSDRVLVPLPLHHSLALRELRGALIQGGTVVLQNGFTFARELENNIVEHRCTGMVTVPASFELVRSQMQEQFAPVVGRLRYIEVGAGSLTVRQRKDFTELLPDVRLNNTWGSSETGGALFTHVNEVVKDPVQVAAIGRPLSHIRIAMLGADGEPMAHTDHEHPGRLAIYRDMVMSGYKNRPQETEDALRGNALVTNDLVYQDADGYVYMLGRADDIINVGGEKVSPIEVENVASEYPQMTECACIGVPDPGELLGQVPVLFMVVKNGYTEEDLKSYLSKRLERAKMPQAYMIVQALPRNRMKKLDRKAMRALWDARDKRGAQGPSAGTLPGGGQNAGDSDAAGTSRRSGAADLMNPVVRAILSRHSIRKFTPDPVPADMLEMILKAGYHAPSGHNMQTWRFTVVQGEEKIEELKAAVQESAKAAKVHCYGFENPACVILVSNDVRNHDGCQDASCAAQNMLLAAHSYGLGAVWLNPLMTLRDQEPVKTLLDSYEIPARHTVWSMVALGWPAQEGNALAKKENVIKYV